MSDSATLIISDSAIRLYANESLVSSGYARMVGDQVVFDLNGDPSPLAVSRLHPNEINHRYWQYCDESAVASNAAGMRHCADLVWRHVSELKQRTASPSVNLLTPSHYQTHQSRAWHPGRFRHPPRCR